TAIAAAPVPQPPGDNKASEEALRKAIAILNEPIVGKEINSDRIHLLCAVAELSSKLGHRDITRDALKKAREDDPTNYLSWYAIAESGARIGDVEAVLDLGRAVPDKAWSMRDLIYLEAATAAAEDGHARASQQIIDALSDKIDSVAGKNGLEWIRSEVCLRL